jgi:hypothetical protein
VWQGHASVSARYESHIPDIVKYHEKQIPNRLRVVLGERSQRKWAEQLRVPQQNLSRYLAGSTPKLHFLIHVCREEGVNLNWLMAGVGPVHIES